MTKSWRQQYKDLLLKKHAIEKEIHIVEGKLNRSFKKGQKVRIDYDSCVKGMIGVVDYSSTWNVFVKIPDFGCPTYDWKCLTKVK